MFNIALFTAVKKWKLPKCSLVDEWIKNMWYLYTMEYYSAIIKSEIMPFVTMRSKLEGIMLNEISQTEQDIYHDFTYTWNLKNKTNKQT